MYYARPALLVNGQGGSPVSCVRPVMQVTFTRTAPRGCLTTVRLDDGRSYQVPVFSVPKRLPHDLCHFAVEHELGWQTGFWGYVARGAVFPGMQQTGGRRPFHAEQRVRELLAPAKDLLGEGENLVATIQKIVDGNLEHDARAVARLFENAWWPPDARANRLPLEDIRRGCGAVRLAEARWRALAIGDSLQLTWSLRRGAGAPEPPLPRAPA
jgi:hypothetical protein